MHATAKDPAYDPTCHNCSEDRRSFILQQRPGAAKLKDNDNIWKNKWLGQLGTQI